MSVKIEARLAKGAVMNRILDGCAEGIDEVTEEAVQLAREVLGAGGTRSGEGVGLSKLGYRASLGSQTAAAIRSGREAPTPAAITDSRPTYAHNVSGDLIGGIGTVGAQIYGIQALGAFVSEQPYSDIMNTGGIPTTTIGVAAWKQAKEKAYSGTELPPARSIGLAIRERGLRGTGFFNAGYNHIVLNLGDKVRAAVRAKS